MSSWPFLPLQLQNARAHFAVRRSFHSPKRLAMIVRKLLKRVCGGERLIGERRRAFGKERAIRRRENVRPQIAEFVSRTRRRRENVEHKLEAVGQLIVIAVAKLVHLFVALRLAMRLKIVAENDERSKRCRVGQTRQQSATTNKKALRRREYANLTIVCVKRRLRLVFCLVKPTYIRSSSSASLCGGRMPFVRSSAQSRNSGLQIKHENLHKQSCGQTRSCRRRRCCLLV